MKKKGWQSVRAYYMAGVAAALLAYFISIGIQSQINIVGSTFQLRIFGFPVFTKWSGRVQPIVGFYLVSMMASILFKLFFNNPVEVGICRFFIESREAGASAGFDRLFWVFGSGSYLNVVKVLFLRDLYTLLWSLLLVLPGIYKQIGRAHV